MKSFWKYLFISISIFLVLGYLCFSIWHFADRNKEKVCCRLVVVVDKSKDCGLITENEIVQILEKTGLNPIGKTVKNIRTDSIEYILRKNPMVKTAECYKLPSGRIDILVKQRNPMFRVVGTGSYYIDDERKPLPVSLNYAAYIPVVSGHVTVSMLTGKMYDFIFFVKNSSFWNAQIEQIYVREDQKIELVPRVGDAIILLGTVDNYKVKLEKLRKLYTKGFNVIGWNKYKLIDLQYKNQVVCNKKEEEKLPVRMVQDSLKKDSLIAKKI